MANPITIGTSASDAWCSITNTDPTAMSRRRPLAAERTTFSGRSDGRSAMSAGSYKWSPGRLGSASGSLPADRLFVMLLIT